MNTFLKKTISILACVAIVFGIAVPFCMRASSEDGSQEPDKEVSGLEMNKSYDPLTKTITLEAYVTGETVTTYESKVKSDIVLALDITDSMNDAMDVAESLAELNTWRKDLPRVYRLRSGGLIRSNDEYVRWNESANRWEREASKGNWVELKDEDVYDGIGNLHSVVCERLSALKIAVVDFIKSVADANVADPSDPNTENCRIGVVTFTTGSSAKVVSNLVSIGKDKDNQSNYSSATNELISKVLGIDWVASSTAQSSGLKKGLTLYDSASDIKGNKVMIMFTDGEPNSESASGSSSGGYDQYDAGIKTALDVKNKGVTLYTVGILDSSTNVDRYMNYMSSKYPKAESMTNNGKVENEGKYYYPVNESQSLDDIFEKLSKEINTPKANIETLTNKTTLRDIISEQFTIDKSTDRIHVYTQDYLGPGDKQWDTPKELVQGVDVQVDNTDPKIVNVTGFDYSANWCGPVIEGGKVVSYRGKKLVVTIPVKVADGVHGITGVDTNEEGSGIIDPEGNPVNDFKKPKTDIPTDVTVKKVFAGYTPMDASFTVEASASAHFTGRYTNVDNYEQAVTEESTYSEIVFDQAHLTYDGIKDLLVSSEGRPSTVTVTEKSVPAGYEVIIADNMGNTQTFTADGGDVSKTFNVVNGLEITITNNKLTPNSAKVTVINHISGNMINIGDSFDISGSYKSADGDETVSGTLKDEEQKIFENVEFDSTFTIYESKLEGYVLEDVKVNGESIKPQEDGGYTFTVKEDTVVELFNVNNQKVEVGVKLEYIPFILLAILAAAGFTVVFIKIKTNRKLNGYYGR